MPDTVRRQREFALAKLITARTSGKSRLVRNAQELVVIAHLEYADSLAGRYRGRGMPLEDLRQTARLALVQAVQRWDPALGEFLGFATPTITGSLKRYFRDQLSSIRIPRSMQEVNHLADRIESDLLAQHPRRTPSDSEIASAINLSVKELSAARAARRTPTSIDLDQVELATEDHRLTWVEQLIDLDAALRILNPDERVVVRLYYGQDWSQSAIAGTLGVSQMQVSRIHNRIIEKLRQYMAEADCFAHIVPDMPQTAPLERGQLVEGTRPQ